MASDDDAMRRISRVLEPLFAPGMEMLCEAAIEDVFAIGRAQGLREAAGMAQARSVAIDTPWSTAAVEELEGLSDKLAALAEQGGHDE